MNPDTFKLTGDTLPSVHQEPDDDEEMIFGELYRELVEANTRATRSQRGCGRGIRVGGRGKGLLVRRTSGPVAVAVAEGITQTYVRRGRGSSSSNPVAHDDMDPLSLESHHLMMMAMRLVIVRRRMRVPLHFLPRSHPQTLLMSTLIPNPMI